MISAPMPCPQVEVIAWSTVTRPSGCWMPWMALPSKRANNATAPPIGASMVTLSPAAKPSSEMFRLWTRVRGVLMQ